MNLLKLFKKRKDAVINSALRFEPFDFGFLLEMERQSLIQMRDYFKVSNISEDDYKVYTQIRLAVQLLNIVLEEDSAYHYNNGESFVDIYINPRNSYRFMNAVSSDVIKNNPVLLDDLRIQKAWFLYNKLRFYSMQGWWN